MRRRLGALTQACGVAVRRRPGLAEAGQAAALLELLEAEHGPAGEVDAGADAIDEVQAQFELSELDTQLLTVAAAADLDVRYSALFGLLTGNPSRLRPSAGLALELCGQGSLTPEARHALGVAGPLRRQRLLVLEGGEPAMLRSIRAPERVVAHLLGQASPDPVVADLMVQVPSRPCAEAKRLARAVALGVRLAHVRARPGTTGAATAVGAFDVLGAPAMVVDLDRRPADSVPTELVALAARDAAFGGAGLVLTGVESSLQLDRSLVNAIEAAPVPTIVVDDLVWDGDWARTPMVSVEATALTTAERSQMWATALDPESLAGADLARWQDLVSLRMTPEDIVAAAQSALLTAAVEDEDLSVAHLREAAREQGSTRLQESTSRTVPRATLDDLVLPEETRRSVDELLGWVRNRETLLGTGRLMGRGSKGRGLVALFTGSPGTGKTLAAEAIAGELGIDLFTVDLSSVLDKYIGETEKHLERIISEAESLNVLLFFDEADALFGSRSAVNDARDRYANHGVSYLLQRIERFDGLAVLATNYRGNIDRAFSRRMHHIVNFADPNAETRRRLWESHLGEVGSFDQADPIDLDWLSETVELPGGDIRNVVLTAAFAAAAEVERDQQVRVGMRHVALAVKRSHDKLGRRAPVWPGASSAVATGAGR